MTTNRRSFLQATAGMAALASSRIGLAASDPPAKQLSLGVIGTGWYGMVDAKAALKCVGAAITAICDVDSDHLAKSADELEKLQGQRPKTYKLYSDFLNHPGLDAVIIATPPHWHALQFIAALEKKLDIYCEKPLGYDICEGRAMVDAAKKAGRIVQVGFQRRQSAAYKAVKEFIDAGEAGNIVQADVQINYTAGTLDPTPQSPPASLDWELWCGPGPTIPYSPQVGHKNWRLEKTSGHGHLVDWGIHMIDATRRILGLSAPKRVVAAGGIYSLKGKITTPDTLTSHFEFDRCPVVWRHRIWGAAEWAPEIDNGILFFGDKATVLATDNKWVVVPRDKTKAREEHVVKGDLGVEHMRGFLNAVRERQPASCSIDDAFLSTTTVQLAMISYETNSTVDWDAATEQIVGNAAATRLLKRDYRAPYRHPYQG